MSDALHIPNNAPEDVNPIEERLREANADLFRRMVQLEEEASDAPAKVETADQAAALTLLASRLQKIEKEFDAARVDAKAPYLEGTRTVDAVLGQPIKTLTDRRKTVLSRVDGFHRAEAARKAAEAKARADEERWAAEEARRAAEAARANESHQEADQHEQEAVKTDDRADALAAKAAAPQRTGTRTEEGSTFQVTVKTYEVTDAEAFRDSMGPMKAYLGREAVEAALLRAAKSETPPTVPGVRFYETTETRVRGAR